MTTIVLLQKVLTMRLDTNEFQNIKQKRLDTTLKKQKTVPSLRNIIDQQVPNKTCRLCLKPGLKMIFGGDEEFNIALSIKCILGLEITEDDGKPQHVCGRCENTLRQAVELRQTAETSQWRLEQELEMVTSSLSEEPDWISEDSYNHGGVFKVVGDTEVARKWQCSKCRKTFDLQDEFREHERQPTCRVNPSPVVCEICGMELKNMSRLKRHRLTHTGALYHQCAQCPYRTRTKSALTVHEHTHTGARPLTCALCGARFRSPSGLASHNRRHQPPRYKCDVCQRTFTFRIALNNHIATKHSNAKPYSCSLCGKLFSTRKMFLRHELKDHNRPKMRPGVSPNYLRQQNEANT